MVPLIAFICVLEPVLHRKKSSNRKTYVFSHSSVLICDFSIFFYFTTVSGSASVSEFELFFGFGSGQNLRILSDSDPQHCYNLRYGTDKLGENIHPLPPPHTHKRKREEDTIFSKQKGHLILPFNSN
jgi:hypothetical protein